MFRYADLTVNDRNPIKRNLQRIRLRHALKPIADLPEDYSGSILDFGAATENTQNHPNIALIGNLDDRNTDKFDYIFCLEVFEHLPQKQMEIALNQLRLLSSASTKILFGVPNEIYLAAFLKGLFRMTRRFGDVDATPINILKASVGSPPKSRPESIFSENLPYIYRHMGFDYRSFLNQIKDDFKILNIYGSPFPFLTLFFNFEIFILTQKFI